MALPPPPLQSFGPPEPRPPSNLPPPVFERFQVIFSPDLECWIAMVSDTEGVMFETEQEAIKFHGAIRIVDPTFASEMMKVFITSDRIAHR